MPQKTEKKIEMILKELKTLSKRLDRLARKVDYIDRSTEKYGDEFSVTEARKGPDGRLVLGKKKKLTAKEKRKLVGLNW